VALVPLNHSIFLLLNIDYNLTYIYILLKKV
jgi:hypothetical protein